MKRYKKLHRCFSRKTLVWIILCYEGGENLALEALKEVKATEEHANLIIKEAQTKANETIKNAHLQGQEQYNNIIVNAKENSKSIIDNAIKLANDEAAPVLEKGYKEKGEILKISEDKKNKAVNLVIERIVNIHGNS